MKIKGQYRGVWIFFGIAVSLVGLSAGRAAPADPARFGEFVLKNVGGIFDVRLEGKTVRADLRGPSLAMTSKMYDMSAGRIQATAANSRVNKALATGNVRIVVRQPEAQRVNTVTCDNAFYTASPPPATGRIDLRGNVRWVARDPTTAKPFILTGETGFIELLGPNTTRIVVDNGTLSVTPREPAPKAKKPQ